MANGWGGARPGAGRKSFKERHAAKIEGAENVYARFLKEAAEKVVELGRGATRIEEEYAAAATITLTRPLLYPNGQPMFGRGGKPLTETVPAYPDRDPSEMVLIRRKVVNLGPDLEALKYAQDRCLGKPVAAVEAEVTGAGGEPLLAHFGSALARVYGESATAALTDDASLSQVPPDA